MDAVQALRLLVEWGADEALEAAPISRLQGLKPPASATSVEPLKPDAPTPVSRPTVASVGPAGLIADRAAQAAAACDSLPALFDAITHFEGLALVATATQPVLPAGDPNGGLLLVGEPPSSDDDRSGQPFSGRLGELLDKMLASIGLRRGDLMLAPLIPWRPPGDRPPSSPELAACLPLLWRLIALMRPRRVVLMGPLTARALAGSTKRPQAWAEISLPGVTDPVSTLVTHGPAQVLRAPAARPEAWADLRLLRRTLDRDFTDK